MDLSNLTDEQKQELQEKLKNMSPEELAKLQQQQCIFCQIISGKIPSKKIYEDDVCIVILDINPATKGHVLIIPKEHYAIMPQVPDEEIGHMYAISKKISQAVLRGLRVQGTNIYVANGQAAGQKAQHFMIHVIPRKGADGIVQMEEKLMEKASVEKVKLALQDKVNSLLGVEIQQTLNQAQEKESVESNETQEEKEEDDDINLDELFGKKEETPEPEEELVEEPEQQEDEQPEPEPQKEKEDNADASLDDIANLFK